MLRQALTEQPITYGRGFFSASNLLSVPEGTLADGSRNQIMLPTGSRPFKGFTSKGANTGSRITCTVGSTFGGIKDVGGTLGSGSLFEDIGRSLWSIGAGQVSIAGANVTGYTLSSLLKVSILSSGVYQAPYFAGLPIPSAPDLGIVSTPGMGYTGEITGPVSCKIARLRNTTGARSVASTTSPVVVPSAQTVRVTFPAASSGQDYWAVFFTQQGFGGVGLSYRLAYQGSLDISEAIVAAGTVDGIARSLEFDYKDGDLVPELAYVDDYVPPAGTHAVRLENVMCVLGCYADATTSPTSTNPGTCGAISLPNFYESYKPRNLVYFPEQVVTVLARPSDSYAYVFCRNSTLALQYVGVQDGPACAVTMIYPDVGIAQPQNACQAFGQIYMWIENGGLVRMDADGEIDYTWSVPVKEYTKSWDTTTTVGFNPATLSIVAANGNESVSYSLQGDAWSTPSYFTDAGVSGSALSCATSRGELVMSVNNSGSHTAYTYDSGASSMPITSISNHRADPDRGRSKNIYELDLGFETDNTNPVIISVHRNMRKAYVRDAVSTSASNLISSALALFDSGNIGDEVCIFGTNIGGAGVNFLIGRILTVPASNQIRIVDPNTGATLNAQASLTGCYMLIGAQVKSFTVTKAGQQFFQSLQDWYVQSAYSYQIGISLLTSATSGQAFNVIPRGTVSEMAVGVVN